MSITSKDIAKLAGVSRGTVDRALNDRGQISADIKKKILKIAADHGYVKNALASNLAKNKRIPIAIVLPDPKLDAFWQAPLSGIKSLESFVKGYGMHLEYFLFNHFNSISYTKSLQEAIDQKPKAILLAPLFLKESLHYLQIAHQNNIAVICINSELENSNVLSYIGQNSYECGQLAGKLFQLSNTGKKEICTVTLGHNSKNAIHIENKINGLRYFCKTNDLPFNIRDIIIENFNQNDVLEDYAKKIVDISGSLHGLFFTNSRAYRFLNSTRLSDRISKDAIMIGFDLIPQNIDLLLDGSLDFILNQNPQRQGYLGIVNLFNHFIYKKTIPAKRYLPIDIVMKENYEFYLKEDELNLELVI